MALNVNLPNFLAAGSDSLAGPNLLDSLLKGYQQSQIPKQMKLDEEKQKHMIEKLMLGNQNARVANQYQEPMLQQGMQQGAQALEQGDLGLQSSRLNLNAMPGRLQDEELARQLGLAQQQFQVGHQEEDYQAKQMAEKLANAVRMGQLSLQDAQTIAALAKAQQAQNTPPTLTEQQKAYEKARGASLGKFYQENTDTLRASKQMQSTIDELKKILSDPKFSNAVGPIDSKTNFLGRKATRELSGKIKTLEGKLLADYSKQFPGSKSDMEMKLYLGIIPSAGDSEAAFKGKVTMLDNLNKYTTQRTNLISKLLNSGMDESQALERAYAEIPEITSEKQLMQDQESGLEGTINGKKVKVRPSDRERFLRSGGVLI